MVERQLWSGKQARPSCGRDIELRPGKGQPSAKDRGLQLQAEKAGCAKALG